MQKSKFLRGSALRTVAFAGLAITTTNTAFAQDNTAGKPKSDNIVIAQADQPTAAAPQGATSNNVGDAEVIVVTGSRIARPTLDSPVPVTTLSQTELTRTGRTNIGEVLNQLPQLAPTYTQSNSTQFIGTSGLNILDLRNLGVSRTLVMVDGQRHITSQEGEFLVDVNTIPNDLIERVDVVTGGTSAVYGSDAMAGVVNFVMKKHFEGISLNAQGGLTSYGSRGTYKLSGTFGKNFAEGRGNIAVALEYDRANPLYFTDRPGLTGAYAGRNQFQLVDDPSVDNTIPDRTFLRGIHSFGYSDGGSFIPYANGNLRDCNGVAAACLPNGFPRVFLFQPDGTLKESNYGVDFRPVGSGNNQGGDGATLNNTGVLDPGLKRYVVNAIGHFDVSDAFRPYFNAKFVRVISTQVTSPTFSQGGPQDPGDDPINYLIYTPIQLDNAFLTPQARALIASQLAPGSTFFNLNRNNVDLGSRGEHDRRDTFRIVGGVEGTFNDDWHYDVAVNYGKLNTHYAFTNNRIEQNFYNSIDAVRNGAGQIVCRINQVTVTDPACQPIDILGFGGAQQTAAQRQAALDYFNTTSHRVGHASELDINASVQGDSSQLFELPGGPIRFSIGAEYRRETASYAYDDLVTSGATFLNAINPFTPPSFEVKEAFAEVDLPIIKDRPFFEEVSLSGAGRVADYKGSAGTVFAYNGAAIYAPVKDIRFRVNYSRSVRAPTLGDLYSSSAQDFASVDDPCDVNFINKGKASRPANCAAAGVPVGFANQVTRSSTLPIVDGGNPDLRVEKSRSWTYGVILQPRFVPGMVITVDYYDIKISNVIQAVDPQTILNGCYDGASLDNSFCKLINPRVAGGNFANPALLNAPLNYAAERAKGIDLDVAYNHRFNPDNNLALRFVGNWTRFNSQYPYIDNPTQPFQLKGSLGQPEYRFTAQADYTYKKFTVGYTMQYIGKQSITDYDAQHQVANDPGSPFDPFYADRVNYPHVIYHDVRASLEVNDKFTLYGGVDNFTNKSPPFGLLSTGQVDGDGIFDNVGRFMYMGIRVKM
jgi:outer membrane receptor protein involved in Fe transport